MYGDRQKKTYLGNLLGQQELLGNVWCVDWFFILRNTISNNSISGIVFSGVTFLWYVYWSLKNFAEYIWK